MNKHGCSVGSRGSVGSSLVAFLSGISEVNPLKPHYYCKKCQYSDFNIGEQYADGFDLPLAKCPKCGAFLCGDGHDIPFETFLGLPSKPKTPDIDLNVGGEYQTMAHNFIRNEFGKNHTFRAGTISTMQQKKAYAEVRSYFEKNFPTTPITFGKID
jgi:DNA polymerase-3 subunit alpha (Gram-positive type)